MRKMFVVAALATFAAGALSAGTVYVPFASDLTIGGIHYTTELLASNADPGTPRRFSTFYIPAAADGTQRSGAGVGVAVDPARTLLIKNLAAPGTAGMLEIAAAPQIALSARLVASNGAGNRLSISYLPLITSDTVAPAGERVDVQGWDRQGSNTVTHFALINLGGAPASCSIKVMRANGTQVGGTALLQPVPLSMGFYPDALALLGETHLSNARAELTCDQPFYAFALVQDVLTGHLRFVPPSGSGRSTLVSPAEGPGTGGDGGGGGGGGGTGGGDGNTTTSGGALVFEVPGLFHVPAKGSPESHTRVYNIQVPTNKRYGKVIVDVDVTNAGWYAKEPNKHHSVFWLHRGKYLSGKWESNVFGNIGAYGGNGASVKMATNVNLGKGQMQAAKKNVGFVPGGTYHFRYVFDTDGRNRTLSVSQGGKEIGAMQDNLIPKGVWTDESGYFMIYFGHENHWAAGLGPEVPSYGWQYSNLRVAFQP